MAVLQVRSFGFYRLSLSESESHSCQCCCVGRYKAGAYAWELLNLEVRYVTIAVGCFMRDHPIYSAQICIAITLIFLVLQLKYKPYLETNEEAKHWSSSNKMGILGYFCQLVVLVVGLISIVAAPLGELMALLLATVSFAALVLPLILTLIIIAPCSKRSVDIEAAIDPVKASSASVTNPLQPIDDEQPVPTESAVIGSNEEDGTL
jgi:hypothetical protein